MMGQAYDERAPLATNTAGERAVGEIVSDLWQNTEKLVRQEMQLGLAEIDDRVDKIKTELMIKVVGGAVLHAGFLAIVASIIFLLAKVMDPWLSALIVGVVMLGAGYLLEQRKLTDSKSSSVTQNVIDQGRSFKEAMK
jgi:hypothetical protein